MSQCDLRHNLLCPRGDSWDAQLIRARAFHLQGKTSVTGRLTCVTFWFSRAGHRLRIKMKMGRNGWLGCAGAFTLLYLIVSLTVSRSFGLTLLGDVSALALLVLATVQMAAHALSNRGQTRSFWILMASGFAMWAANQTGWSYYELLLRRDMPDPLCGRHYPVPSCCAVDGGGRSSAPPSASGWKALFQHFESADAGCLVGFPVCLYRFSR